MGILGTIGTIIIVGGYFDLFHINPYWYIGWWVVVILEVVILGVARSNKS